MEIPKQYTDSIESWLPSLTITTYPFKMSPIHDNRKCRTIFIGDVHADPRGLISALYISKMIDREGNWIGNADRIILLGDVLDGANRGCVNPTVTPYDELLCLRIIFTLKTQAQAQGGDIIWVLGNHDVFATIGQDDYLHPLHALGYGKKQRKEWFAPGTGILAFYMAKCGILAGKFGDILVSHAGILPEHLPYILHPNGATNDMRLWLLRRQQGHVISKWFHSKGVMVHREYDIRPFTDINDTTCKKIVSVSQNTNTKIQIIGHNYRPNIQKIQVEESLFFLIDTGISRSFGPESKVQSLIIDQNDNTYMAYSVKS